MFYTHLCTNKVWIGYGNLFTQACTSTREMFVYLNAYNTHIFSDLNDPYPILMQLHPTSVSKIDTLLHETSANSRLRSQPCTFTEIERGGERERWIALHSSIYKCVFICDKDVSLVSRRTKEGTNEQNPIKVNMWWWHCACVFLCSWGAWFLWS